MTPAALHLRDAALDIDWQDGRTTLAAAALRRHCRCAECLALERSGRALAIAADIALTGATPAGAYGVQLHFSDGHARGIYPWAYLRELARPDATR